MRVLLSDFPCAQSSTSPCLLVNHLPLEIWQHIFTLACVDGGYTGTSLALVSQFFHHASHPVRFRSLLLSSLRQIEHFLDYVQKHSRSTRDLTPRVNHLLLAFPHVPSDDSNSHDDDLGTGGPDLWYNVRQLRDQEKARWDERFMIVVPRLLDFAAPHLESLTLVQSDGFMIPPIRHYLPRLRELTIFTGIAAMLNDDSCSRAVSDTFASPPAQGTMASIPIPHYPDVMNPSLLMTATHATEPTPTNAEPNRAPATSSLGHPAAPPAHARARFPALERLHLVCGRHRDWTLRDPLARLPTLAPALTHLRISNATYTHGQDGCIPDFLCAALGRGLGVLRPTPGPSEPARAVPVRMGLHRDAAAGGVRARTPLAARPVGPALPMHVSLEREQEQGSECEEGLGEPAMRCLRRVAVHSVPPPLPGGRCASPYKDYDGLVQAVRAMGAAWDGVEGADVRVKLTEGERMKHEVWVQLVRAQWLDRIGGGRGCWDEDNDFVLI